MPENPKNPEIDISQILVTLLKNQTSAMEESNKILLEILKAQKDRETLHIMNNVIIPYSGYSESQTVTNPKFERARIKVSAIFSEGQTGGLSIDLYYKNTKIGEVLRLKPTQASVGGASQTFDVSQLSDFHFLIMNHDSSKNAKVNNFDIVMFNEK